MKKVNGINVSTITKRSPQNNLPKWVKEAAETRGYADSLEPISLYVTDCDIDAAFDSAAHGDGSACVMAQAGRRLGAKNIYFFRTTAWVDFGTGPIVRFVTSESIYNNVIDPFDRGVREGVAAGLYHLTPATQSRSLLRRRQYERTDATRPYARKPGVVYHTDRVVMAAQS